MDSDEGYDGRPSTEPQLAYDRGASPDYTQDTSHDDQDVSGGDGGDPSQDYQNEAGVSSQSAQNGDEGSAPPSTQPQNSRSEHPQKKQSATSQHQTSQPRPANSQARSATAGSGKQQASRKPQTPALHGVVQAAASHQAKSSQRTTQGGAQGTQGAPDPSDAIQNFGTDAENFADKSANRFVSRAETHYEQKATATFDRAEGALLDEGDQVMGCMENLVAKWWNNLIGKKDPAEENKPPSATPAVAARA